MWPFKRRPLPNMPDPPPAPEGTIPYHNYTIVGTPFSEREAPGGKRQCEILFSCDGQSVFALRGITERIGERHVMRLDSEMLCTLLHALATPRRTTPCSAP